MTFICENCKNKSEIPEELKSLADSLKPYYKEVIYCKALETIVVANSSNLCQTREKCDKFTAQA